MADDEKEISGEELIEKLTRLMDELSKAVKGTVHEELDYGTGPKAKRRAEEAINEARERYLNELLLAEPNHPSFLRTASTILRKHTASVCGSLIKLPDFISKKDVAHAFVSYTEQVTKFLMQQADEIEQKEKVTASQLAAITKGKQA